MSAQARTAELPSLWPEARTARRKPELQTLQHWLIICCHHHPHLWLVRVTSLLQILGFRCWDGNSECENVNLTIYFLSRSHCVHVGASGACAGGGGGLSSRKPRLLLSSWAEPAPGARQLLAARGISSAVRLAELCSPREAGHKPTHLHTQCAVCRLDTFPHLVSCRWLWTRLNKTIIDTLIYRH